MKIPNCPLCFSNRQVREVPTGRPAQGRTKWVCDGDEIAWYEKPGRTDTIFHGLTTDGAREMALGLARLAYIPHKPKAERGKLK